MENNLEHEIRDLAYHIWRSAQDQFGQAIDFWVMAEKMVVELTAASAGLANTTAASVTEAATNWPTALRALYFYRVGQLAQLMCQASTEHQERSMDYWLAAEKHLRLLIDSAVRGSGTSQSTVEAIAKTFENFSPVGYLEQIRKTAYSLWETSGGHYGSALDFWLAAEKQIMEALASDGMASAPAGETEETATATPTGAPTASTPD